MTNQRTKGFVRLGSAARLALRSILRAKKNASGGVNQPEQIQRIQPAASAGRGSGTTAPTGLGPAIEDER